MNICRINICISTPLKFNMEPENQPLEKTIPFGKPSFSRLLRRSFSEVQVSQEKWEWVVVIPSRGGQGNLFFEIKPVSQPPLETPEKISLVDFCL